MNYMTTLLLVLFPFTSSAIGFFLFSNPNVAIEMQRRFYEKINWRIEPISMQKEVKNTKLMGLFVISVAISTMIYLVIVPVF